MINSFDSVYDDLRKFSIDVGKRRLGNRDNREFEKLLERLKQAYSNFSVDAHRTNLEECLEGVAQYKNLHTLILKNEHLPTLMDVGFTMREIAILFRTTEPNIRSRLKTYQSTPPKTNLQPPPFLHGKDFKDYTNEDWYMAAKWVLFQSMMQGDYGKNAVDAAGKVITDYRQVVKDETVNKWQQLKLMDEFYMTKFLPRLYKDCSLIGGIDVKSIFRDILIELSADMKSLVTKAWEVSEMDKLIEKAKRRGKWIKKKEESVGSIVMLESEEDKNE